jgi:hypothetical protein
MRARKSEVVKMGEGAYYDPKASQGSLDHNYRYLFLDAIERRTPEVLSALRSEVWPEYEKVYWGVSPSHTNDYWMYTLHPTLAWSWLSNTKPPGWTAKAFRALAPLKKSILRWAKNHGILADWMLMRALDSMLLWTIHESHPSRLKNVARLNRELNKLLGITEDRSDGRSAHTRPALWWVSRRWYFPKAVDRQFTYAAWAGEDETEYERRLLKEFQGHLAPYLGEVKDRAKTLPRIPVFRRPERFEMLALYLCRGMTREQIAAETEFNKDPTVIYRDLNAAAKMIGLQLRKPGK